MTSPAAKFSLSIVLAMVCSIVVAPVVMAQSVVFGNHREVAIPDYATVRIGPFYSTVAFTLSVGYRYVDTYGAGTDFLQANERGEIRKDGSELPIIATLDFRNYLLITRRMDVDMSIRLTCEYYPLDTQADVFDVDMVEEGILGTFSSEIRFSPYLMGNMYDTMLYKTDFVDTRGIEDRYGGQEYAYFRNRAGVNCSWLMAKDKRANVSFAREDNIPFTDEFDDQEYVLYDESAGYIQTLPLGIGLGATAHFWQYDYASDERQDASFQEVKLYLNFGYDLDRDVKGGVRLTGASTLEFSLGVAGAVRGELVVDPGTTNMSVLAAGNEVQLVGGVELKTQLNKDLRHVLAYRHGIRGAFDAAYEVYDSLSYRLDWDRQIYSAYFRSAYVRADSLVAGNGPYDDWITVIGGRYPLQRRIFLTGEAGYDVRDNSANPNTGGALESREDYETAYARIGTDFELTKRTRFRAYAQHLERLSANEDLAYGRNMAGTDVVYRHQF